MLKFFRRLFLLTAAFVLCAAIGVAVFFASCSRHDSRFARLPVPKPNPAVFAGIKDYARDPEDTYFTYPEWYIVWSYQEKADFQQQHLPAAFPFFGAIGQYWQAYCTANSIAVSGHYPFNLGDHLMLMVIGSSFTAEYAIKGAYESTIGRLSEWCSGGQPVEEDRYAAKVAKEYADFVHIRPFYEFSFKKSFQGLWRETSWWGPHPLRKWERKFILGLDYAIESAYCGALTGITHAVYGIEPADTYAQLEAAPPEIFRTNPHIKLVKQLTPDSALVDIPRYQEFTDIALRLAPQGVRFANIAGNAEVLITALVPTGTPYNLPDSEALFTTEILTDPAQSRTGIRCTTHNLTSVLAAIAAKGFTIEHVYDF